MLRFTDTVEPAVDERFALEDSVAALRRIRDLLLPKLVTGQIDISRLDLDVLLADEAAA
jgi:type I restriction enzyme S subunit